jgi:hypothetical protein
MSSKKQTILRFVLKSTENPLKVMSRFFPQGKTVLNRTEWWGKEPRSCGLTNMKTRPASAGSNEPKVFDVEVTHRPKGCITFVGPTKYDGWTAMILDRKKDGTLLDGHGNPLPEGQPPVYLPLEVHEDAEFNEIDFGEFVDELEVEGIPHVTFDDVLRQMQESPRFSASIKSTFMAPRRHRPLVKIVLSNAPSGTGTDGFGTRIVNVNSFTPHLQEVLLDELWELVSGFIEGRYSIKNFGNEEFVFVELSDSLVDCTPNEEGKDSRFNCLNEYVPATFIEDLAERLIATFEIQVSIVDGPTGGLLLKLREPSNRD